MPEEARKAADNELERLRIIPPESAEHSMVRTYLEWLVNLPWAVSTEDHLDIPHARQVLDEDHYDLEKIKDRILEYLACGQAAPRSQGTDSCASLVLLESEKPRLARQSRGPSAAN